MRFKTGLDEVICSFLSMWIGLEHIYGSAQTQSRLICILFFDFTTVTGFWIDLYMVNNCQGAKEYQREKVEEETKYFIEDV